MLYPTPKRSLAEYREAYQKFVNTLPIETSMRVVIEENQHSTLGAWHEVYGKNGTLVKEVFQTELARQQLEDKWESEQEYALSYTDWAEIVGMEIDPITLSSYPEKEIMVHVLLVITERWRSDEQNLKVLKELEAIADGREENLIRKESIGRGGFRQTWSEKENGEFHGYYTVYWENGLTEQRGFIIDGDKEGVWTYWNKSGKIERQARYWCDRELEVKFEFPWWEDAQDQNRT
jgi:hypothetical protein